MHTDHLQSDLVTESGSKGTSGAAGRIWKKLNIILVLRFQVYLDRAFKQ